MLYVRIIRYNFAPKTNKSNTCFIFQNLFS